MVLLLWLPGCSVPCALCSQSDPMVLPVVLPWCSRGAPVVLPGCSCGAPVVLPGCSLHSSAPMAPVTFPFSFPKQVNPTGPFPVAYGINHYCLQYSDQTNNWLKGLTFHQIHTSAHTNALLAPPPCSASQSPPSIWDKE